MNEFNIGIGFIFSLLSLGLGITFAVLKVQNDEDIKFT